MLVDGITLTPSSIMLNSLIEQGSSLPTTNLRSGRVFYLTQDVGDNKVGTYVYSGTTWSSVAPASTNVVKYDIGLFCGGKIAIGEAVLASFLAPRSIYFEANLPQSVANCKIPPLATTTYIINVNDVASGTVTFVPGQTAGTIVFEYSMLVQRGDTIELLLPATPDTAISDVGVTLVANVEVVPGVIGD